MRRSVLACLLLMAGVLGLGGCASQAVLLKPGPVPFDLAEAGPGPARSWSLWVADARDARPTGMSGPRVGTLYTRIRKDPQTAYMEPNPEVYIRGQFSRYLLGKGLEASGANTAKALLYVELEEFSVLEDPGSVWDQVNVRIVYAVRIVGQTGQDLGRVKLEGNEKITSPLDTRRQVEKAFRDALTDTFEAFFRSEALRAALAQLGG